MRIRIITLAVLIGTGCPLAGQNPGSVTGTVVDDAGKPVARARVFIHAAFPPGTARRPVGPPVITGPFVISTMTDRTGAFQSGHLPAGKYVACAHPATQGLLNPCHWTLAAPEFTIIYGKTTTGVRISLAKGAIISIHVNDPRQLLAQAKGNAEDLRFHLVTPKGHHYEAAIVGRDNSGQDHWITVPFGMPLTLKVVSQRLAVDDETGKPAAAAGRTVNIPPGSSASAAPTPTASAIFTYTVTGAK